MRFQQYSYGILIAVKRFRGINGTSNNAMKSNPPTQKMFIELCGTQDWKILHAMIVEGEGVKMTQYPTFVEPLVT